MQRGEARRGAEEGDRLGEGEDTLPREEENSFLYFPEEDVATRTRAVASPRSSSFAHATPGAEPSCGMRMGDVGDEREKKAV